MYIDFLASVILGGAIVYSARSLCKELSRFNTNLCSHLSWIEQAIDRQTDDLADDPEIGQDNG